MSAYDTIPAVCKNCQHFDSDWSEWYGTSAYFCNLNIYFTLKKQTCKKQKPIKEEG